MIRPQPEARTDEPSKDEPTLRTVQYPVDPQATPLGEPSRRPVSKGTRPGSDLVAEAAKRALTPQEATKVLETFRQLCVAKDNDIRPLEETAEKLRQAGYKQELAQALDEALILPNAHPQVGALWMRRLVASNSWDRRYPDGLDELCKRGEIGHRAVLEFLEVAAAKRKARLVRRAIRRHADWLRTNPRGWSVAARALVTVRCYRTARAWMSDWGKRPELDLGLLHCLVFALRGSGRFNEAHDMVGMALGRPGAGQQFPVFKVWSAMEEALAGNIRKAASHFNELKPLAWDDDLLCRYYLARGVVRVQQAEGKARKEAFALACDRIKDRFRRIRVHQKDVLLRREYRRCFWRMSLDSGNPAQAILAVWRSADSWFFLLPLLVIPGLQLFLPLYLYRVCSWRKGRVK